MKINKGICLKAIGILAAGALLAGCGPTTTPPPLTLEVESVAADEAIVLALENPTCSKIFVPAAWTGLLIYQQITTGTWKEYKTPDVFQPSVNTSQAKVEYTIPTEELEPGNYRLVLQGRYGGEGTPFTLETIVEFDIPET